MQIRPTWRRRSSLLIALALIGAAALIAAVPSGLRWPLIVWAMALVALWVTRADRR
jgi:hypothetical protein